jgi:hypothetical protein
MRRALLLGLSAFALASLSIGICPAADDAPHRPSVSDLMGLMQLRHMKLWYAGSNRNWPLLRFEAAKMRDTIALAAVGGGVPTDMKAALERALDSISQAAVQGDEASFLSGYAAVTNGCNACHQAMKAAFIRIQTPTRSPFADQVFAPQTSGN